MNLAQERKQVKKTQDEIAHEVGLSRSGYANIENGSRKPSVETAKRIATVLGFDWTRFFDDKDVHENSA